MDERKAGIEKVTGQANLGPVVNIANEMSFGSGGGKTEAQLQQEFYQQTGIWCSRPARELFNELLEQHNFVAPDLEIAWRYRYFIWHKDQYLATNLSRIDRPVGAALIAVMCVPVLLLLLMPGAIDDHFFFLYFGLAMAPPIAVWLWIERTIFHPWRTASRAAPHLAKATYPRAIESDE